MSLIKRRYKQIEAFFSRVRPIAPDSPSRSAAEKPEPGAAPFASPSTADAAAGWQHFFTGSDRGQKMGFTYDQEEVTALEKAPLPLPENSMRVPLVVSGTTIGTIQAAGNEAGWTAKEIEIVSAVAAQLAHHLENLLHPEQNGKRTH
jgi:GAF domain-containing protein